MRSGNDRVGVDAIVAIEISNRAGLAEMSRNACLVSSSSRTEQPRYSGVSHAEWPKDNETAQARAGSAIRCTIYIEYVPRTRHLQAHKEIMNGMWRSPVPRVKPATRSR
jgi:hypothetical protein